MARKRRVHYPGAVYHVMLRGNEGQGIFFDDEDRFYFGELLLEGVARFEHRIHGFCLMGNHVHLVVQVGVIPLSRIIQNASFRYTRWINTKHKRMGHLFQGRYKAILVDADKYLLEIIRYVHLNPVRNGLVNDPEQYFWSSHAMYTGKRKMPWVHTEWVHAQFSRHLGHARRMYRRYVEEALEDTLRPEFEKGNKEGRILGDDHFAERALQQAEIRGQLLIICNRFLYLIMVVNNDRTLNFHFGDWRKDGQVSESGPSRCPPSCHPKRGSPYGDLFK